MFYFLLFLNFNKQIESFFEKKDIFVTKQDIFENNPSKIHLSTDKFMFAIKIEQEFVEYIDKPLYLVKVQ